MLVNMAWTRHVLLNMAPNESVKATERIHDRALDNKKQIDDLEKRKKNTCVWLL